MLPCLKSSILSSVVTSPQQGKGIVEHAPFINDVSFLHAALAETNTSLFPYALVITIYGMSLTVAVHLLLINILDVILSSLLH